MAKRKRWIISSDQITNPITGQPGDSATVYTEADLNRRLKAAKKAGIKVNVREAE